MRYYRVFLWFLSIGVCCLLNANAEGIADHELLPTKLLVEANKQEEIFLDAVESYYLNDYWFEQNKNIATEIQKLLQYETRTRAILYVPEEDFHDHRTDMNEMAENDKARIRRSCCFLLSTRVNAWSGFDEAVWLEMLSTYDCMDLDGFDKVAFVVYYYSEELPIVLVSFSGSEVGDTILKTTILRSANDIAPIEIFDRLLDSEFGYENFVVYEYE